MGIRRMDKVPNAWIRELCEVVDESIDESVLQWFGHVEIDRIAKRVYVEECADSRSVVGRERDGVIP